MHLELVFSASRSISAWAAQHEAILMQHSGLGVKVLSLAKGNLLSRGIRLMTGM